ncbi:DUF2778 domain-containing protein [Paraburkholderia sp. Ac-20342]|uniref:DUF2778 domain-containing protein n=1 Tax=unclassified Paraburkholderia TaxID=2615204 RepID=UPI0014211159|nr:MULTISPECIES: DUF2778 domain-containing protein [unclassified Paraburkholderia]MBN3848222.1 DUF2778 domain-containing protein [Paraburkholderia sp. Ac-20342]NIF80930.1 DUF2778 domain-containing protein [Paraburkholderia sp. Cy-641]
MALTGKFVVDNQEMCKLDIIGIGTFRAYSGNKQYMNRGGCTDVPKNGPIPVGKYWIVDRPKGGFRSQAWTTLKDVAVSSIWTPVDHREWFGLYRDDGAIDDVTWVNGVERGNFRLHPAGGLGVSLGCITMPSHVDFSIIRSALLRTETIPLRNSGLHAYGTIEVVTYGNTCP